MGQTFQLDSAHPRAPITMHVDRDGGITGLTVVARIGTGVAGEFLDFNDLTFKSAGHVSPTLAVPEVDAGDMPGWYAVDGGFDISTIANLPAAALELFVHFEITAGGETGNDVDVWQFLDRAAAVVQNAGYFGAVWIDANNGAAGAVPDVNGTSTNPTTNLADALTIAAAKGLRAFVVIDGTLTLTAALTDWSLELRGESAVALAGQNVNGSVFKGGAISGAMTGTIAANETHVDSVSGGVINAQECGMSGTVALGVGESSFDRCHSREPGLGFVTLDFVGAGRSANVRGFQGGLQVENMVDVTNVATLSFLGGAPRVDASCTAGTVDVRGHGKPIVNNTGGTTVVDSGYLDAARLRYLWKQLGGDPANAVTHTKATVATDGAIATPDSEVDVVVSKPDANTTVLTQQ